MKMLELSIAEITSFIKNKKVSPVEITETVLQNISEVNSSDHIFISVLYETAIAEAQLAEKEIMQGEYKGPLHGVPISVKDNISVKNTRRTCGSILEQNQISKEDAFVVKQLRSKGAIIIGKTNLDEFANHVVGENKHFGTIKHPFKEGYSVGGSSGGSAVSVARDFSFASVGTDTSGSVRIPASSCGIVGLKPTYNLIPPLGVKPLSWSLDHVGLLTKNCSDLSIVLDSVLPGVCDISQNEWKNGTKCSELTVGLIEDYFDQLIDVEVSQQFNGVLNQLEKLGVTFKKVKIDHLDKIMESQEIIIGAEFASIHQDHFSRQKHMYEPFNREFIEYGLTITDEQYKDALFIKEKLKHEFYKVFSVCDILFSPTLPIVPPKLFTDKIDWKTVEEDILITLSRFTGPFNVSGLPALTIPIGWSKGGLPIGIQIVGNFYKETQLITLGNMLEEILK